MRICIYLVDVGYCCHCRPSVQLPFDRNYFIPFPTPLVLRLGVCVLNVEIIISLFESYLYGYVYVRVSLCLCTRGFVRRRSFSSALRVLDMCALCLCLPFSWLMDFFVLLLPIVVHCVGSTKCVCLCINTPTYIRMCVCVPWMWMESESLLKNVRQVIRLSLYAGDAKCMVLFLTASLKIVFWRILFYYRINFSSLSPMCVHIRKS